jgi:serine/threonine protein phosphatase PrpC
LVICSDGIHGVLTDNEITSLVTPNGRSLDEVCRAVIAECNAKGGPDNATTVLVEAIE